MSPITNNSSLAIVNEDANFINAFVSLNCQRTPIVDWSLKPLSKNLETTRSLLICVSCTQFASYSLPLSSVREQNFTIKPYSWDRSVSCETKTHLKRIQCPPLYSTDLTWKIDSRDILMLSSSSKFLTNSKNDSALCIFKLLGNLTYMYLKKYKQILLDRAKTKSFPRTYPCVVS